jgi:hypothetical protein
MRRVGLANRLSATTIITLGQSFIAVAPAKRKAKNGNSIPTSGMAAQAMYQASGIVPKTGREFD